MIKHLKPRSKEEIQQARLEMLQIMKSEAIKKWYAYSKFLGVKYEFENTDKINYD